MLKSVKKERGRQQAQLQVESLFEKAQGASSIEAASEFVRKARKLAMKYRMRLPTQLRRAFCRHCYTFFVQGKNVRIRTSGGKVVYSCRNCKKFMRFMIPK